MTPPKSFSVIITGSTGMVGEGVLIECLEHPAVTEVLVVNRRPLDRKHPKLKEVIHKDFTDFSPISNQLSGYDACFHCMGVSSIGMDEEQYTKLTYGITRSLVDTVYAGNPDTVFNYVSGEGTDREQSGSTMWARVKGRTEQMILDRGFRDAYMFRPGAIVPEKGVKSRTGWVNTLLWVTQPLYPWFRKMDSITTSDRIGLAMINSVLKPWDKKTLKNQDINELALRG
ncbi:epimerase [Lewinellaceae bacterium SD302]|nr:epimerase [Lewinellaceae bacterium SD302]